MDFSTLLNHPDVDEIVTKLLTGTSPKNIYDWLQLKYSKDNQSHLRITQKLLQEFQSSQYMDLYQQVEKDLEKTKGNQKIDEKIAKSLLNKKSYRDRLNEIADEKVDLVKEFRELKVFFYTRMEQIFDKIQEDPGNVRKDTELSMVKYAELWLNWIEKHEKFVNNRPDQIIQHNYVITYLDQCTNLIQNAIQKVFMKLEPELAFKLMEEFNQELAKLKAPEIEDLRKQESSLIKEAEVIKNNLLS